MTSQESVEELTPLFVIETRLQHIFLRFKNQLMDHQ